MHIKWTSIAKAIMLHLDILFNLQTTILIATLLERTGKKEQIKEKVKERSQHQMHYYTLTRKCFIP